MSYITDQGTVLEYPHALFFKRKLGDKDSIERKYFFSDQDHEDLRNSFFFDRYLTEEETMNLWKGMYRSRIADPESGNGVIDLKTGEFKQEAVCQKK